MVQGGRVFGEAPARNFGVDAPLGSPTIPQGFALWKSIGDVTGQSSPSFATDR